MKTIDIPPFAPVLMESTRAMGYSLEAAVADIIDNIQCFEIIEKELSNNRLWYILSNLINTGY